MQSADRAEASQHSDAGQSETAADEAAAGGDGEAGTPRLQTILLSPALLSHLHDNRQHQPRGAATSPTGEYEF